MGTTNETQKQTKYTRLIIVSCFTLCLSPSPTFMLLCYPLVKKKLLGRWTCLITLLHFR